MYVLALVQLRRERHSSHSSVKICQRHTQTRIFALVAFVKVQAYAKTLQIGVGMGRQHEQKRLDEILFGTIKEYDVKLGHLHCVKVCYLVRGADGT